MEETQVTVMVHCVVDGKRRSMAKRFQLQDLISTKDIGSMRFACDLLLQDICTMDAIITDDEAFQEELKRQQVKRNTQKQCSTK